MHVAVRASVAPRDASTAQTCGRRALLRAAGAGVGAFVAQGAVHAFGLPSLPKLPNVELPKLEFPTGGPAPVDKSTPMDEKEADDLMEKLERRNRDRSKEE